MTTYLITFEFEPGTDWEELKEEGLEAEEVDLELFQLDTIEIGQCVIKNLDLDKIDNWCKKAIKKCFKKPKKYLEMYNSWGWKEDVFSIKDKSGDRMFSKASDLKELHDEDGYYQEEFSIYAEKIDVIE